MASITSSVGIASGINSKDIIDQLMALEQRPKVRLLTRIDTENKKKAAYTDLQTRLTGLRLFGTTIKKPQTFRAADVKSSDEKILTGSAATGAATGSYRMSVARLVTSQQAISKGFSDVNTTPVGAGTLTLELGGGDLASPTKLEDLNGGGGVRRGQFRITDRSGKSTVIDTTDALTIDDVVRKINTSLDVSVKAQVKNDALVLTDQTGQAASNFRIEDVGDGHAAEDLGILQNTGSSSITGSSLGGLRPTSTLAKLNDGRGVGINSSAADIRVTMGDGTVFDVALNGAATMGDVITKINGVIGAKGYADFAPGNKGIRVVDTSVDYTDPLNPPPSNITIAAINGSTAATDLGLAGTGNAGGWIDGSDVVAGVNTTLVNTLRGGRGLDLGTIRITDRGGTVSDINLAGASTVEQILDRINAAAVNVVAEVRPGGNGISITDKTNRLGQLSISDLTGTAAAQMGLAGWYDADEAHAVVNGANLQKAWFTTDTLLRDLNGGKGIPDGKFKITDSAGKTRTIDVKSDDDVTVGDLMAEINSAATSFGVTASINANGDGLLLTDTAGGTLRMKVEEVNNGTVAKSLNLLGTATATTIDGSWEKTVTITATDKLQDVQKKIQDLNWGLSPAIINDGSGEKPYRLSLTSTNTGRAGRVVFDSGAVNLGERVLVEAQDAAVFVGSEGTAQPMLITASSNQITGAIRGVTLKLSGVSKEPVTVNVARNVDNVVTAAAKFVEDFNGLVTQLKTYTKFDSATNTRGELLGDTTAQSVESELYGMLNTVGNASGKYRIPSDVGIRVGEGGMVEFDEQKFRNAYADDPEAITTLFTRAGAAIDEDYQTGNLRAGQGVRTVAGADFRIDAKDGTGFDVDVSDLTTMGQVIDAINNATGNSGKVLAAINAAGTGIDLTDKSTTGTKKLTVSTMNGSIAASDLGLLVTSSNGRIQGRKLIDANSGNKGGIGAIIEKRVNRLIDPTSGVVSRASKEVDNRNDQFQTRIESIDKLVQLKRARLERQFANLESSLSSLQGQQAALSSFTPVPTSNG